MKQYQNYLDIEPIKAYVKRNVVMKDELSQEDFIPCQIVSLSIYKDEVITANILLEGGEFFTYVPFNFLKIGKTVKSMIKNKEPIPINELKTTYFNNCPGWEATVNYQRELQKRPACVYIIPSKLWIPNCKYHFTVDFIHDNDCVSLLSTPDGDFVFAPFHKIKFVSEEDLDMNLSGYVKQEEFYRL